MKKTEHQNWRNKDINILLEIFIQSGPNYQHVYQVWSLNSHFVNTEKQAQKVGQTYRQTGRQAERLSFILRGNDNKLTPKPSSLNLYLEYKISKNFLVKEGVKLLWKFMPEMI